MQPTRLPVHQGLLRRPRLHAMIQSGLERPLLVVLAGPGYGKTQAVADYLSTYGARVLWLRLNALDNLPTHFWTHILQALGGDFPAMARHMQRLGFPDSPASFDAFRRILAQDIASAGEIVWVFDDFGEIDHQQVKDFVHMLADISLEQFHLVILSNVFTSADSIAFMNTNRALILGHDMRFTLEEIAALYSMHGILLEPDEQEEIQRYTEGWPLPLHLMVLQHSHSHTLVPHGERLTHNEISFMFERRFFSSYLPAQQKMLVKLALVEFFTRDMAFAIYEGDKAELDPFATHMFITNEPATGRYFLHHLYKLFLQEKTHILNEGEETRFWRDAAAHYMALGAYNEAITAYRGCGDYVGMLDAFTAIARAEHGTTREDAAFLLEHLDLLTPEQVRENPVADYLRAQIYLNLVELDRAEELLLALVARLEQSGTPEALTLLGDAYASIGALHMMSNREDFGDYYQKASLYLPEGSHFKGKDQLLTQNNHSFSMADNRPGAKARMERAVHNGIPWVSKVLSGGTSGLEYVFSAEAAYLSHELDDAQQHAYRAIYKAEAAFQHDLVCNAYFLLARIGFLQGNMAEMSKHIQSIAEYARGHEIGIVKEIRDTALGWYYIKLHELKRIPRSLLKMDSAAHLPTLAYGRVQILYGNYLILTGEYAKLVGMLEHPKGLYLARGIWTDRIFLYVMLAIGYHHLGKPEAAMDALWTAYDMTYHNGLITPFIEGEEHMRALVDLARQQKTHVFAADWLDGIYRQAGTLSKRTAAMRAVHRSQNPAEAAADNPLTRREMEILQSLSRGLTREEIAVENYISINTVKTFIRSIYHKLGASNRAEAISTAIRRGLIDITTPE